MRFPLTPFISLVTALVLVAGSPAAAGDLHLTGSDALSDVYRQILNADFEAADAALRRAGAHVPDAACEVLEATSIWWRIQLDPNDTTLDAGFTLAVEEAIETAETWTAREPHRAEAWFYLGGAYAVRVPWRVLRGERLAAARDGKRIKEALERAIALDAHLEDAYFGIGLYRYYADIAPAAAKLLRWVLLLPGGNREEGLAQMLRTRDKGELLRSEADYQLYLIYLWYEKQPDTALTLLRALRERHPANPLFWRQTADVENAYLHDVVASLASYRTLLEAAQRKRVNFAAVAATEARLGMARAFEALGETDRAIEQLTALVEMKPAAPHGVLGTAYATLGAAYDRIGERESAVAAYLAARANTPAGDAFEEPRARVEDGLRRAPNGTQAAAYRLSLEGLRHLEHGALDRARTALDRAMQLDATNPLVRYRYARLLQAQGDPEAALAHYQQVIRAHPASPPTLSAAAYCNAGQMLELTGQPAPALEMYQQAAAAFGAGLDTREAARRAAARLQASPAIEGARRR